MHERVNLDHKVKCPTLYIKESVKICLVKYILLQIFQSTVQFLHSFIHGFFDLQSMNFLIYKIIKIRRSYFFFSFIFKKCIVKLILYKISHNIF